jgi:hypothetical protein
MASTDTQVCGYAQPHSHAAARSRRVSLARLTWMSSCLSLPLASNPAGRGVDPFAREPDPMLNNGVVRMYQSYRTNAFLAGAASSHRLRG